MTWSNIICGGRDKRGALVEKDKDPWQRNVVIIFFGEETMTTREWSNLILFSFKIMPLLDIYSKNNIVTFWCMLILLGPHSIYT